ncbi:hypothetical protein ADUPG1_011108, partial [Aduncisulcus paluster]
YLSETNDQDNAVDQDLDGMDFGDEEQMVDGDPDDYFHSSHVLSCPVDDADSMNAMLMVKENVSPCVFAEDKQLEDLSRSGCFIYNDEEEEEEEEENRAVVEEGREEQEDDDERYADAQDMITDAQDMIEIDEQADQSRSLVDAELQELLTHSHSHIQGLTEELKKNRDQNITLSSVNQELESKLSLMEQDIDSKSQEYEAGLEELRCTISKLRARITIREKEHEQAFKEREEQFAKKLEMVVGRCEEMASTAKEAITALQAEKENNLKLSTLAKSLKDTYEDELSSMKINYEEEGEKRVLEVQKLREIVNKELSAALKELDDEKEKRVSAEDELDSVSSSHAIAISVLQEDLKDATGKKDSALANLKNAEERIAEFERKADVEKKRLENAISEKDEAEKQRDIFKAEKDTLEDEKEELLKEKEELLKEKEEWESLKVVWEKDKDEWQVEQEKLDSRVQELADEFAQNDKEQKALVALVKEKDATILELQEKLDEWEREREEEEKEREEEERRRKEEEEELERKKKEEEEKQKALELAVEKEREELEKQENIEAAKFIPVNVQKAEREQKSFIHREDSGVSTMVAHLQRAVHSPKLSNPSKASQPPLARQKSHTGSGEYVRGLSHSASVSPQRALYSLEHALKELREWTGERKKEDELRKEEQKRILEQSEHLSIQQMAPSLPPTQSQPSLTIAQSLLPEEQLRPSQRAFLPSGSNGMRSRSSGSISLALLERELLSSPSPPPLRTTLKSSPKKRSQELSKKKSLPTDELALTEGKGASIPHPRHYQKRTTVTSSAGSIRPSASYSRMSFEELLDSDSGSRSSGKTKIEQQQEQFSDDKDQGYVDSSQPPSPSSSLRSLNPPKPDQVDSASSVSSASIPQTSAITINEGEDVMSYIRRTRRYLFDRSVKKNWDKM